MLKQCLSRQTFVESFCILANVEGLDNYNDQMNHVCQVCLSEKPEGATGQGFSVVSGLDFRAHIPEVPAQ